MADPEEGGYCTTAGLARFLGVSSRTVERWWSRGLLPEPEKINPKDRTKMWSPEQRKEILRWHLNRK